jgi:hypothetical protein
MDETPGGEHNEEQPQTEILLREQVNGHLLENLTSIFQQHMGAIMQQD